MSRSHSTTRYFGAFVTKRYISAYINCSKFVTGMTRLMTQERCIASCLTDCNYWLIGYCWDIQSYRPAPPYCHWQWYQVAVHLNRYLGFWSLVRRNIDRILKLSYWNLLVSCDDKIRCRQHRRDQCQWSTVPMSISDFWDMCSSIQLICNGEKDWHKDLSYIWCSLESTGQILAIENLCTCVLVQCLDEDWVTDYTLPSNEGTVKCAGEQCLLSYICAG